MKTLRNRSRVWLLLATFVGGCGIETVEVRDDFTGRGVPDAKVSYTCADTSQEVPLGRTDSQGSLFLIMPKDVTVLKVIRNGYRPYAKPLAAIERRRYDDALEIRLIPLAEGSMPELEQTGIPRF